MGAVVGPGHGPRRRRRARLHRARGPARGRRDARAPGRRQRRGCGHRADGDDARGPQRRARRPREHGCEDPRPVGRPSRRAGPLARRGRRDDVHGEPRFELARQRRPGVHADRTARARARARRSGGALARRHGDGRRGVPSGGRRDGDVHGEPHDGRGVRVRPRLGHLRLARPARGRTGHAGVRRSRGLDRGAQVEPVLRRRAHGRAAATRPGTPRRRI